MNLPFTIGITGGSGSGKTFFLKGLSSNFNQKEICLISQDNYYKSRDIQPVDEKGVKNFDLPISIDRESFHHDLCELKAGKKVSRKEYLYNNPKAKPEIIGLEPAPIIVVEGLFVQYFEEIDKELDLRIFIEAKDHVKLGRRIKRDKEERGYDLDDVLYRYQNHVMPVYESMIEPLKSTADILIPNNSNFKQALNVLVGFIRHKLDVIGN